MVRKLKIFTCCTLLLPIVYQSFAADVIELKTPETTGQTIVACEKIVLTDKFSFIATPASGTMRLGVSFDACTPTEHSTGISAGTETTSGQNYIVTVTPLDETGTVSIDGSKINVGREYGYAPRFNTTIQYFDGLGRPVQTVQRGIAPDTQADLISLQEYDAFGRESKSWLPAPNAGNGAYVPDAGGKIESYYDRIMSGENKPFSLPKYEASPLNRVVSQYGPGKDWHPSSDDTDDGKAIRTDYLTNNSNNPCLLFEITSQGITKKGNYDDGSLYVTKVTDEDGKYSLEFKDKLGQVVLTRQEYKNGSKTERLDTYYIYDDFGNLSYVLPPLLSDKLNDGSGMSMDASDMKNYAYVYKYDHRKRCVTKRLPGCDWILYVYDKGDRLILTQDGEMRKGNKWVFTKYDPLGRVILTGFVTDGRGTSTIREEYGGQHSVEQFGDPGNGSDTWYSYPNTSKPRIGYSDISTVNFYDDHTRLHGLDYIPKSGYDSNYENSQGLLIGTIEHVQGFPNIETKYFYDERGRVIQTQTKNHLGKMDVEYVAYNFAGQPTKKLVEHGLKESIDITGSGSIATINEDYSYSYDHAGRLTETKRNNVVIARNEYNELGQLKNKSQEDILNSAYTYNIRGWTKSINETKTGFSQELKYNEGGLYNGNITGLKTSYGNTVSSDFTYTYDQLNRLQIGTCQTPSGRLHEERLTYDKHGNPQTIIRLQDGSWSGSGMEWLSFTYRGNQMEELTNDPSLSDPQKVKYPDTWSSFSYNENGALTKDTGRGIVTIEYNYLNLPKLIQFSNGNQTQYTYSAGGQKLRTKHIVSIVPVNQPIVTDGQIWNIPTDSIAQVLITDYVGNIVYEDYMNEMFPPNFKVYHEEGYDNYSMDSPMEGIHYKEAYYYLKDYIGNNRDVVSSTGYVAQRTEYYPFGTPMEQKVGSSATQPYKYSGKEFDQMHGLSFYDFHARQYDPLLIRFTSIDPLAENYYSWSPYAYCAIIHY